MHRLQRIAHCDAVNADLTVLRNAVLDNRSSPKWTKSS